MELEKKSSNKSYITIIVILIIMVLGLGGYLCYDKILVKDNTNQENMNKEEKKIEKPTVRKVTEEEISSFVKQIDAYNMYLSNLYPIKDASSIDNQEILKFGYKNIENFDYLQGFTKESIDKTIKKYFGNSFKYVHEDINCFVDDGVLFKFDSNTEKYSFNGNHGHGGEGNYRSKYYFQDGEYNEKTNTYQINTKVLYGQKAQDITGPVSEIYVTAADSEKLTNKVYEVGDNSSILGDDEKVFDEAYNNIKDQIPITTYIFVKDNEGNYGLKSVSI